MDRTLYDALGRTVETIANHVPAASVTSDRNKRVLFLYTADGLLRRMTVKNVPTGDQLTEWTYGTTLSQGLASNLLLRRKRFPKSPFDRIEYTYNRQGETASIHVPSHSTRALVRDLLGRVIHDRVTSAAVGVDGTVRRISTSYRKRGGLHKISSWSHPDVGSGLSSARWKWGPNPSQAPRASASFPLQWHPPITAPRRAGLRDGGLSGSAWRARRGSSRREVEEAELMLPLPPFRFLQSTGPGLDDPAAVARFAGQAGSPRPAAFPKPPPSAQSSNHPSIQPTTHHEPIH